MSLDTLPPELADIIAPHLALSDLCSLRAASRQCNRLFTDALQHHVSSSYVDLTRVAIKRLCFVGTTPLGPMVRRLRVNVLLYHDEEKDAQDDRMTIRYPPDGALHRDPNHETNPWLSDAKDPAEPSWLDQMRAAQHEFSGTEMLVLLTKAFGTLENLDTLELEAVVVTCSQDPSETSMSLLDGQLQVTRRGPEEIKKLPWRFLWTRTMQAYQVLMAAVSRARPKSLERLSIFWETRKCAVLALDIAQFLSVPENADGFAFVAARLKEFAITIGTDLVGATGQGVFVRGRTNLYDPCVLYFNRRGTHVETWEDEEGEVHSTYRNALMPLLRHLGPLLRTFQLRLFNSNSHLHAEGYTAIMRPMTKGQGLYFPHLEKLCLRGLSPMSDSLHRFIRKHSSHLQELELDNITLRDESQWTDLLRLVSQRCVSLETLRLGYLRTDNISPWKCLDITPTNEAYLHTPTWKWTSHDSWRAFHPGPGRVYYVARKIRKEEIQAGLSHKGLVNVPGRDAAGDRWLKALQAEYGPIH